VRDELRSLPNDLADLIACHLVAAERALGDDDAALAYEHAKVARRFAARIGVVREVVGLAAYRAGNYAEALSDLRAGRRMTGSDEFLPIMADCERGLGRPERALDLVRSKEAERLDRAGRIELAIVESGARRDLGQHDAAVITLQRVPELRNQEPHPWSARLAFAYADALAEAGHEGAATDWFERAMMFDEGGETDAAERYAELTGSVIEDVEEDEQDGDEDGDVLADVYDDTDVAPAEARRPDGKPEADVEPAAEATVALTDEESDAGELDLIGEEPEIGPVAEESGAVAGPDLSTPAEKDEAGPGEDLDADVQPEPAGVPDGAIAGSTEDDEPQADPAGRSEGDLGRAVDGPPAAATAKPELKTTRLEPGMAPAFIEPDFGVSAGGIPGDVLEDDDVEVEQPDNRKA
jgi:hypothetical protein